ncbi:MAG: hypothetical protein CVV10_08770 [Gammaproteobacteria bacterium HGW-Gammaproteobacteria-14]|nr:MAG: hypothetical protein CVV10_08770 [Gammaproteobacteria bacterium HGW-Gammaproteobacteria-14]
MSFKKNLIQAGFRFHRLLIWGALLALLVFVVSGSMHLLLTWTGPQSMVQRPPQQFFSQEDLHAVVPLLQQHGIESADIVKLVPSADGPLLQVSAGVDTARRYFDLARGIELKDQDEKQARWLAQYYLGSNEHAIESVRFVTEFDREYSWVNRLLPVYRLQFSGDDALTLFVHTETLALASITNNWKRQVQWLFQQLHTFAWLDDVRHLRVILMALLLVCVLGMVTSGMALLYALKRKRESTTVRRGHRIVAYVVVVPLLGFAVSGFYHLIYSEYVAPLRDFNIAQPLVLPRDATALESGPDLLSGPLHGVNLLAVGGELYFRASLAQSKVSAGEHDHHSVREQRFRGVPREQGSVYWPAVGGNVVDMNDAQAARRLAMDHLGLDADQVLSVAAITHFGPGYDFRNKRLPVWKVSVDSQPWDELFIDVASGLLVDRSSTGMRAEGLSFSILHKWNFLAMPLGRQNRDALLAMMLGLVLLLAGAGVFLHAKRQRKG